MHVKSCAGDFDVPASAMNCYHTPEEMPKADVVIVTLKTTANAHLKQLITPVLHESTAVLTLQNGLGNEQTLAELFGEQRVLGGLAFVCINRISPGEIHHSDYGLIKIGEYHPGITARLKQLHAIFNASKIECQMLDHLALGRWEKLVWNVPFNGLGAAMDLTSDRIVGNASGLALAREIMREVVATAHAIGVMIDPALVEQNIAKTLTMGPYKSSMQIDRQVGRPMEIEAIIGAPLKVAQSAGVPTPCIEMLYRQLCILDSR